MDEHEHGRPDQRRERSRECLEPALGEDDPLEALLGDECPPQHRVLLIDEA